MGVLWQEQPWARPNGSIRALADAVRSQLEVSPQGHMRAPLGDRLATNELPQESAWARSYFSDNKLTFVQDSLDKILREVSTLTEIVKASLDGFQPGLDDKSLFDYVRDLEQWTEGARKNCIVARNYYKTLEKQLAVEGHTKYRLDKDATLLPSEGKGEFIARVKMVMRGLVHAQRGLSQTAVGAGVTDIGARHCDSESRSVATSGASRRQFPLNPSTPQSAEEGEIIEPPEDREFRQRQVEVRLSHNPKYDTHFFIRSSFLQFMDQLVKFNEGQKSFETNAMILADRIKEVFATAPALKPTSTQDLAAQVDEVVCTIIYEVFPPIVKTAHSECSAMLNSCRCQIHNEAWTHLQRPLAISEGVHTWVYEGWGLTST